MRGKGKVGLPPAFGGEAAAPCRWPAWLRRRATFAGVLLGVGICIPLTLVSQTGPAPSASGYIRLRDGEALHYVLWLPAGRGPFPVALDFDPYFGGSVGNVYTQNGWTQAGYALLGVSMRGTGCSSGSFDVSNTPQWGTDGAEVIGWAAAQPWSSGHVGMFGASFPAVAELGTAAFAGPALAAIAPFSPWTDLYRAPAYLGGIYNKDAIEGLSASVRSTIPMRPSTARMRRVSRTPKRARN